MLTKQQRDEWVKVLRTISQRYALTKYAATTTKDIADYLANLPVQEGDGDASTSAD